MKMARVQITAWCRLALQSVWQGRPSEPFMLPSTWIARHEGIGYSGQPCRSCVISKTASQKKSHYLESPKANTYEVHAPPQARVDGCMQRGRLIRVRCIPQDVVHRLGGSAPSGCSSTCPQRCGGSCPQLAAHHEKVRLLHLCQNELRSVWRQRSVVRSDTEQGNGHVLVTACPRPARGSC